jgi:Tol biopolymer transport system component
VHVLKILEQGWPENINFSPDSRYIVYNFQKKEYSPEHNISLLSTDGSRDVSLVEHPADDYLLGWAPDGKNIIFASDRTGTPDIWAIEVLDGIAHGEPRLIKSNKGPLPPTGLGLTKDGSFYYSHSPNSTDVYVTEIDPETGTIMVPPCEAINRFVGSNSTPDYSPDGKYLAYVSKQAPLVRPRTGRPTGNVLCIRSLDSGKDREFRPGLNNFGFPRWSPDSRSVMVVNWEDDDDKMGHYDIDAHTGEANLVLMTHRPQVIWNHEWSVDGKSVFLLSSNVVGDSVHIFKVVRRDIENGTETELLRGSWRDLCSISRSPDGRWLAVLGRSEIKRDLRILPTTGGEPRVVHTFEQGDNSWIFHVWSADGMYIFLPKYCSSKSENKWDLWRIPVNGGEAQSLGLEMDYFWWLSAHPDGRHIAFSNQGSIYELPAVWVMENFLPE